MASIQPSFEPEWAEPPLGFSRASYAQGPGIARVTVGGELDIAAAPGLGDVLAEAARGSVAVILDLRELTFMDSSGLHAILTAHARLAETGCRLVLLRGGDHVQRIFELTGVDSMLEFVSARDVRGLAAVQPS